MKEGRFRPSFSGRSAASSSAASASMKEGRFRPSFMITAQVEALTAEASMKEGRFRPSFPHYQGFCNPKMGGLNEGGSVPTLVRAAFARQGREPRGLNEGGSVPTLVLRALKQHEGPQGVPQ